MSERVGDYNIPNPLLSESDLVAKPWARMRVHGPCIIWDWHENEEAARAAIEQCAAKNEGVDGMIRRLQKVAYFPDRKDDPKYPREDQTQA